MFRERIFSLGVRFAVCSIALVAAHLGLPVAAVHAQQRIDVSGVAQSLLPVSVASFVADQRARVDVAGVVHSDLGRSGLFNLIHTGTAIAETGPLPTELRGRGIDMLVSGSVSRLANGRFDVRYRLSDLVKSSTVFQRAMVVHPDDLRMAGHQIADEVYEALTGEKGIFSTRIAYVSKQGSRHVLQVADWDAENPQLALSSAEPIISPRWAPDGMRLAYVSFESRKAASAIGYLPKPSGSTPHARVPSGTIPSGTIKANWGSMLGSTETLGVRPTLWGKSLPMLLDCTMCTGTCGSGCRTATTTPTPGRPRTAVHGSGGIVPAGFCGAVPGSSTQCSRVPPAEAGTSLPTGTAALASELPGPIDSWVLLSLPLAVWLDS